MTETHSMPEAHKEPATRTPSSLRRPRQRAWTRSWAPSGGGFCGGVAMEDVDGGAMAAVRQIENDGAVHGGDELGAAFGFDPAEFVGGGDGLFESDGPGFVGGGRREDVEAGAADGGLGVEPAGGACQKNLLAGRRKRDARRRVDVDVAGGVEEAKLAGGGDDAGEGSGEAEIEGFGGAGAKGVDLVKVGEDEGGVVEVAPLNPGGARGGMAGGEVEPFGVGLAIECLIGGFVG